MKSRLRACALLAWLLAPSTLGAQDIRLLAAAESAWVALDYDAVLVAARAALETRLTRPEQIRAHELLAFTYAALYSADQAIEAFRQVVYLDPDRTYDPERISPTLVQLHTIALGRELVVRTPSLDSARFVAGAGAARITFTVSRPAEYEVRVTGLGTDSIIARGSAQATTTVAWTGLSSPGIPAAEGYYRVTISVSQFADRYARALEIEVRHGRLDTLSHLTEIEGLAELPESEARARSSLPLALSALTGAVATGLVLAMESRSPGEVRRELLTFDIAAVATGVALSMRQPPPRPLPSNVEYNRRVRLMLAERNAAISRQNAATRQQVLLTIGPSAGVEP